MNALFYSGRKTLFRYMRHILLICSCSYKIWLRNVKSFQICHSILLVRIASIYKQYVQQPIQIQANIICDLFFSLIQMRCLFRYLPTKGNREIWRLGTSIGNLILEIAKRHEHDSVTSVNKGLLHSITEGAKAAPSSPCTPEDFIVDNCKNIYLAGHETTSTTAMAVQCSF